MNITTIGTRTGALAGIMGAVTFGVLLDVIVFFTATVTVDSSAASDGQLAMLVALYLLLPIFLIGIPVGALAGGLLGLLTGVSLARHNELKRRLPRLGSAVGILVGITYPLLMILMDFASSGPGASLWEGAAGVAAGALAGAVAGRFGGQRFLRKLESQADPALAPMTPMAP